MLKGSALDEPKLKKNSSLPVHSVANELTVPATTTAAAHNPPGVGDGIVANHSRTPMSSAPSSVVIPDNIHEVEILAAEESIQNNLYICWMPHPSVPIPASASDDIRANRSQCCRIGSFSVCRCGHYLRYHDPIKVPKRGYIRPPKCRKCSCVQFCYMPSYPEETGQWWLRQRKDFKIAEWRKRVRQFPEEYACVGCNLKVSDHETIIETPDDRRARNAAIGMDYIPFQNRYEIDFEAKMK